MAQVPESFGQFGGLRLDQPIDAVSSSEAIDMLDVDWINSYGNLKPREGVEKATSVTKGSNYDHLFAHSEDWLLAYRNGILVALNSSLTEKFEKAGPLGAHYATLGTPTSTNTYVCGGGSAMVRFAGAGFTEPTVSVDGVAGKASPLGGIPAAWPDGGNRMVFAGPGTGPNGLTSSSSHVWFSEPGNAEGFESTAYVQVSPGDGERIAECYAWGGMIFVFKLTKAFVFYGVSVDGEGRPVFNYRTIDLGSRLSSPSEENEGRDRRFCAAGPEGLYFLTLEGVKVTAGGPPSLVSDALEPLRRPQELSGPARVLFNDSVGAVYRTRWQHAREIVYMQGRLYVYLDRLVGGARPLLLIYDIRAEAWLVWSAFNASMVVWRRRNTDEELLYFGGKTNAEFGGAGLGNVYRYTNAVATDASFSTPGFTARWQSGFYDRGSDDEKTFTTSKTWGTGEVMLKVAKDMGELGSGTPLKLGTAPAMGVKVVNKSQTGTLFSHQFSGVAPWSVQRLTRYLREERVPTTKTR